MQWGEAQVSTGWLLVNPAKSEDLQALDMGGPQTHHGMSLEIANKFQLWIRSCESGPADELFVVSSRMCVGNPFFLWYPSIAWIEIRDDKLNRFFLTGAISFWDMARGFEILVLNREILQTFWLASFLLALEGQVHTAQQCLVPERPRTHRRPHVWIRIKLSKRLLTTYSRNPELVQESVWLIFRKIKQH